MINNLEHTPMDERCTHEINVETMACIKCNGNYWVVRNDPRPWPIIRKEREVRKAQISQNPQQPNKDA